MFHHHLRENTVSGKTNEWLAGKSTMNESMYLLLLRGWGFFQPVIRYFSETFPRFWPAWSTWDTWDTTRHHGDAQWRKSSNSVVEMAWVCLLTAWWFSCIGNFNMMIYDDYGTKTMIYIAVIPCHMYIVYVIMYNCITLVCVSMSYYLVYLCKVV